MEEMMVVVCSICLVLGFVWLLVGSVGREQGVYGSLDP